MATASGAGRGRRLRALPESVPARGLSLLLAGGWSLLVLLYPAAVAPLGHGRLSLLLWGVAIGFVHGVGFTPRHPVARVALSPLLGWALVLLCAWSLWHKAL